MDTLAQEISNCSLCNLSSTRNHPIIGEGNPNAAIMLVGEAPGADEDRIGRPFIGKSGQLLEKIITASGFSREYHVFLTNIVRCRPPGNRTPNDNEVDACIPYLHRQIELVDPKIIIPLGATALQRLLDDKSIKISKVRGNWIPWQNRLVMPVFHPAALLRNPSLKKDTWEDFKKVITKYRELVDPDHYCEHFTAQGVGSSSGVR